MSRLRKKQRSEHERGDYVLELAIWGFEKV